jgi:NAD(P)-dependent dehydrogenase (short-subunit alcohol dehydrogenase family)
MRALPCFSSFLFLFAGLLSGPGFSPYAPSKFAVEALADSLRGELAEWNIHTSVFEFGAVESRLADALEFGSVRERSGFFVHFFLNRVCISGMTLIHFTSSCTRHFGS